MLFITGSDELNNIDIVLFPKVYQMYSDISVGDIIRVKGKVEKRFDKLQIVVNELLKLDWQKKSFKLYLEVGEYIWIKRDLRL